MFVADYVLMEYGTGAIMAVPGHDARDYEFAQAFDLPIRRVIEGDDPEAARDDDGLPYPGDGPMVNSGRFDGKDNREAYEEIVAWLEPRGARRAGGQLPPARLAGLAPALLGRADPGRLLRASAGSSRCPTTSCRSSCPRSRTTRRRARARWPRPRTGSRPSARAAAARPGARPTRWTPSSTPPGTSSATSTRATTEAAWDRAAADHWMPVDQYIGGVEHAILHLMYARFFTKALADIGHLGVQEPFANLFAQGMITRDGAKMSKSRGNTVSPGRVRRALRRRHRPHLRLLHGPARARRRLDRRGGRGRQPLPRPALAALRGGRGADRGRRAGAGGRAARRASCSPRRTGRSTRRPATSSAASSSTPRSPR